MNPRPSLLLIDNWDSFTHILAHGLEEAGARVTVVKNDDPSLVEAKAENWNALVISPGPGTPEETGQCRSVIQAFTAKVPILGVCLGHQLLASLRGANIIRGEPVHGRTSRVAHQGQGLFAAVNGTFAAARYHSLRVDPQGFPASLRITAWAEDEPHLILALDDPNVGWHGLQFHPESFMTTEGHTLLRSFVSQC